MRSGDPSVWLAGDLFRQAQVHFDMFGRLAEVALPGPPGIMHWTYPMPLRAKGWVNICTVHDLIPLLHPSLTPIDPGRHARLLAEIFRRFDAIVTVSEASRSEIVAWAPAGIEIINCGVAVRSGMAVPQRERSHLLLCGSIEPRKNIVRICEAYRDSACPLPLVIAGPDGWRADDVRAQVGAVPGIVWLPYQGRDELVDLMASARALVMPSLAEGFGLPVIEAMALGTPVITSSYGALAETADGAALLVAPEDVAGIGAAMARISADDVLAASLAASGRERAAVFSRERFAERLLSAYAVGVAHSRGRS